jgi:NAD(P)-dependent dehydrogenase (short-subunit alcohol dehydrogenase family)
MGVTWSQFFPLEPTLTEKNLPSQNGKVFIITGGASGVGQELARILYQSGGKVYIAGRSEANAQEAMKDIKSTSAGESVGELEFLRLDLDDLTTIKPAVEAFKAKESRLDVLFNNAGVSIPPAGSKSKQGHELQIATNCLGPFLLTQLSLPILESTAKTSSPGAVRVVWTSSVVVDLAAQSGGFEMTDLTNDGQPGYTNSKTANWFLASETAHQVSKSGIMSVTQNPGNLRTNLTRHVQWAAYIFYPLLYQAKMGACTELWAGLSPELDTEMNGCYILPWGRIHPEPRPDLIKALKSVEEGGTGRAKEFWDWCQEKTRDYM